MVEFCYGIIENVLKNIEYNGLYPFSHSKRIIREFPDPELVHAHVSKGEPIALVSITDYRSVDKNTLRDVSRRYEISEIQHVGTGTENVYITGNHRGNNRYRLEIVSSGMPGDNNATYKLFRSPWYGSYGEESEIQNGYLPSILEIGDGTYLNIEGEVVSGDCYIWNTFDYIEELYQIREISVTFQIDIWAKSKKELLGYGGYLDQIETSFKERWVTDGKQAIRQELLGSRQMRGPFEERIGAARVAINVRYTFGIFCKLPKPVIETSKIEVGG